MPMSKVVEEKGYTREVREEASIQKVDIEILVVFTGEELVNGKLHMFSRTDLGSTGEILDFEKESGGANVLDKDNPEVVSVMTELQDHVEVHDN